MTSVTVAIKRAFLVPLLGVTATARMSAPVRKTYGKRAAGAAATLGVECGEPTTTFATSPLAAEAATISRALSASSGGRTQSLSWGDDAMQDESEGSMHYEAGSGGAIKRTQTSSLLRSSSSMRSAGSSAKTIADFNFHLVSLTVVGVHVSDWGTYY